MSPPMTPPSAVISEMAGMAPLLEQLPRRTGFFALAMALLFFSGALFALFGSHLLGWSPDFARIAAIVNGIIAFDAVLIAKMAFRKQLQPNTLVSMGILQVHAIAFGVTFAETQEPAMGGLSLVALVIVIYPLFVPLTKRAALLAAGGAVVMAVVGDLVSQLVVAGTIDSISFKHLGNLAAAGLAFASVSLLQGLGRSVVAARQAGAYHLTERIGSGGMGEVWRASHQHLRRPAAVKIIRTPEGAAANKDQSTALLKRFQREAQATAELHSQHTVQIYDFGVSSDGRFYYVMEFLDGADMQTLVEQHGPMSPARAIFLLEQLCDSLDDAHRSGLVHRDIKPANVIVCRYGHRYDFVKVVDFGLVQSAASDNADIRLTADGQAPGTPASMAPEIATGKPADARSDIYAIGCVAYWLVTGALVFDADSSLQVILKHVQERPVPPSERTEMPLPKALDDAILACLAKDPAKRPQSCAELLETLAAIPLESPWNEERAANWWSQHQPAARPASGDISPYAQTLFPQPLSG